MLKRNCFLQLLAHLVLPHPSFIAQFVVRVAKSLAKKPQALPTGPVVAPSDPFENPPSQKLYAGPITPTHSFVFNKFNLVPNHMVVVTNEFESQYEPLTAKDMDAIWKCITQMGGLGFFNGGRLAGASQPHKHLQFLPIPIVPESNLAVPMESILATMEATGDAKPLVPYVNPGLPFYNLFAIMPKDLTQEDAGEKLVKLYLEMIAMAEPKYREHHIVEPFCYNLLITKYWMLFVPRSLECVDSTTISINSMGFAGTLFVKSAEHLEIVRKIGPMGVLKALTLPHKAVPSAASL